MKQRRSSACPNPEGSQDSRSKRHMKTPTSGLACFFISQTLAQKVMHQNPLQPLLPSGARVFYYTSLALKRQGIVERVEPSASELPRVVIDAFLATAPNVARGLGWYFDAAVRLRDAPISEGAKLLAANEGFTRAAGDGKGEREAHLPPEPLITHSAFQYRNQLTTPAILLAAEVRQFFAARLSVVPVARPQDTVLVALRLLRAQLGQDAACTMRVFYDEQYLYEEPLTTWLGRIIQEHPWVKELLMGRCFRPI